MPNKAKFGFGIDIFKRNIAETFHTFCNVVAERLEDRQNIRDFAKHGKTFLYVDQNKCIQRFDYPSGYFILEFESRNYLGKYVLEVGIKLGVVPK